MSAVRLKEKYNKDIVPKLKEELKYTSTMQVPRVEKVVLNMGVGASTKDIKVLDTAVAELTIIAGQKPVIKRAKKSIAGFKLREGVPIACTVTLRGKRMYQFLDKLFNIVLPRIRDFKGIYASSFDSKGNLNIGMKEQIVFPEIDYDKITRTQGLNITIVTTAKSDEVAKKLLIEMGLPIAKEAKKH